MSGSRNRDECPVNDAYVYAESGHHAQPASRQRDTRGLMRPLPTSLGLGRRDVRASAVAARCVCVTITVTFQSLLFLSFRETTFCIHIHGFDIDPATTSSLATWPTPYRAPGRRQKPTYLLFGTSGTELHVHVRRLRANNKERARRAPAVDLPTLSVGQDMDKPEGFGEMEH